MIDEKKLIEEIKRLINTGELEGYKPAAVLCEVYDRIKQMPKVGEWIPCSERLPEKSGKYLVTREYRYGKYVGVCLYNKKYKHDVEVWEYCVLAWMPLPEPWEGEK